ncbi:RING-H2 finger ATL13 [Olea europaea subsp. europaea]|uniref:RING-type E3 ubiquitin transferase n=1 Tax=Olea europaea subsp. europaea TaxID=158383 RepID=A0A8S0PGM8_OLEEU|nr:RING-H2 finger ATL13 [Olea europaea subsp. europaea]
MDLALEIKEKGFLSPSQQPYFLIQPPTPPSFSVVHTGGFNLNNKVSPSILLIIIILAIIFFISGFLHLLVRFLLRPHNRDPDELENVTVLQGQLQQLFHLHDSGVDQSFIDTLPVFNYKEIIGVKDPFDCAVCLCEFEAEDKLRLLPKCSHAFHMDCIDTWLLSHSTCPLCRASLIPDFSRKSNCSPVVLVLESGSESSREIVLDREGGLDTSNSVSRVNSHLSVHCDDEFKQSHEDQLPNSCEIQSKDDGNQRLVVGSGGKLVTVKLGKFKNVEGRGEGEGEGSSDSSADARRCSSMGSFAYVMDENLSLQVSIRTPMKKKSSKKPNLPLTPGHRLALSECGCDSRREFGGFEEFRIGEIQVDGNDSSITSGNDRKAFGKSKRESFSVSKIWLRGKKDRPNAATVDSSRRAFSFRFPGNQNMMATDELKPKNDVHGARRMISELDTSRWGEIELGCHIDQRCNILDSQENSPSFARRTLLWLMGRQNKVVNSSFPSNV